MHRLGAGLLMALAVAAPASAAPTQIDVRTEGREATLFEGAIVTDGHAIRAASDSQARTCDGTNNGAHSTPGPTPTAATVDAMASIGEGFDGRWYPGFDDYFITRFGPDAERGAEFWGVLVNRVLTSAGGCQYRMRAGDLALWVYDAFGGRPLLRLDGPVGVGEPTARAEGFPPVAVRRTFTVAPGQPLAVRVVATVADVGLPGSETPAAGAAIAPVATDARGFQTPGTPIASTDAAGRATLIWSSPGWKRIKAVAAGHVRSNRLDVCVTPCDAAPPGGGVVTPPRSTVPEPRDGRPGSGSLVTQRAGRGALRAGDVRLSRPRITTDGNPTGLVSVRWSLLGGNLRAWTIESRLPGGRWVRRARGTAEPSALLDLPIARVSTLRMRIAAASGATAVGRIGSVLVPRDERLLRFRGRRRRSLDPLAWRRSLTTVRRGGRLAARLPAGRPTVVVRGRRGGRIEVRAAGRRQVVRVRARRDGATRLVRARRRARAGTVRFRVLRGTVGVDGVAATP